MKFSIFTSRSAILVACVVLGLLTAAAAQGGTRGTQYALLISVSKYARTDQWRPLKYAIDEMEDFRAVLTKTGFSADNIVFLHDRQTEEKLRPSGGNIVKKLDLLLNEIGPDDTFLVAFNGHGVQYGGDMTGYFAPVNADLNDKKTLVAMDAKDGVYARLEQCKARKKLLIVNACRNDPTVDFTFAAQKYDLVDREDRDPPRGIAALYSCKPGQKSFEYPPDQNRKRSFFYHHLIEAWQGKYADDAPVSLEHVFDQVVRKTAADARNIFSEAQTPWPRRRYEGEWLLTKAVPARPDPIENKTLRVVVDTNLGQITIELYAEQAPVTVKNFLQYVDDKHYDGTIFHRVIADFMIQGGGFEPGLKEKKTREPIKNESTNGLANDRGTIAMARTSLPDSATSQFYINTVNNKFLDRANARDKIGYTVFGKVVEGMSVVDQIRRVQTENQGAHSDVPVENVVIRSIRRLAR